MHVTQRSPADSRTEGNGACLCLRLTIARSVGPILFGCVCRNRTDLQPIKDCVRPLHFNASESFAHEKTSTRLVDWFTRKTMMDAAVLIFVSDIESNKPY